MAPSLAVCRLCALSLLWTFVGRASGARLAADAPPFPLRAYQARIADQLDGLNGIVLLPTGAGKTAIASEIVSRALSRSSSSKVVFFVPTILLVEQQAAAISEYSGLPVARYHGGESLPSKPFRVLVSTPKAFIMAQAKNSQLLGWPQFSLAVFDEVHHVLKDHPYRTLVLALRKYNSTVNAGTGDSSGSRGVRTLGLTASLSYAVDEARIRRSIERLMGELGADRIGTASAEELEIDGYHANAAQVERLAFEKVDLASEDEAIAEVLESQQLYASRLLPLLVPEEDRKPHLMHNMFWERVRSGTCTPFTTGLLAQIRELERRAILADSSFESPLGPKGNSVGIEGGESKKRSMRMDQWGSAMSKKRLATQIGSVQHNLYWTLEQLYEALRLLVASWEESQESALLFLQMMLLEKSASECTGLLSSSTSKAVKGALVVQRPASFDLRLSYPEVAAFLDEYDCPELYLRLTALKRVLLRKAKEHSPFRGIVFVQQRVMSHILQYFLLSDPACAEVLCPLPLHATSSPATASLSISAAQAAKTLKRFADGVSCNLLIATVVAEEGMDIPAANCVVRFDPVHNAVSHVQGRGRARKKDSSFVVMAERKDRDVDALDKAEKTQLRVAASIAAEPTGIRRHSSFEEEAKKQKDRERNARLLLERPVEEQNAGVLSLYAKKTKVVVEETYSLVEGGFECALEYCSSLRTVKGRGTAISKKEAKKRAVVDLLAKLRLSVVAEEG